MSDQHGPKKFSELVSAYLHGQLSPDEAARLESLLRDSPEHRDRFVRESYIYHQAGELMRGDARADLMEGVTADGVVELTEDDLVNADPSDGSNTMAFVIDQALSERRKHDLEDAANRRLAAQQAEDARNRRYELRRNAAPEPLKRTVVIPKSFVWLGLAAVLGLIAWIGWRDTASQEIRLAEQGQGQEQNTKKPPVVATLADAVGARWSAGPNLNGHLREGQRVSLSEGYAEIVFGSGATAVIEAPATFIPTGPNSVRVIRGRLVVSAPPSAAGFVADLPDARIVDVGTEFGVEASYSQPSYVQVFRGTVYATRRGGGVVEDGAESAPASLVKGQAVTIEPGHTPLAELVEDFGVQTPRFARSLDSEVLADLAYARAVMADKPVLYWRFGGADVPNALNSLKNSEDRLRLSGDVATSSEGGRGWLEFGPRRGERAYAELDGPLPYLGGSSTLTIECWARPNRLADNPILSLREYGVEPNNAKSALLLELNSGREPQYGRRTARFVHRNPPTRDGSEEVVDTRPYPAGEWVHLVAVKTETHRHLYVNGRHVGSVADSRPLADEPLALILGYHAHGEEHLGVPLRQFVGGLDELAIYPTGLTPQQVADHYAAGAVCFQSQRIPN